METTLNQKVINLESNQDRLITILVMGLSFLVPTFLGKLLSLTFGVESVLASKSQLIIGSIVNTCLIVGALNLTGYKKTLGLVTMPSISTIASGFLFNAASTTYMLYMIPAIWLGNFSLIYAYKKLFLEKKLNYFLTGIIGIAIKVFIIASFFFILTKLVSMPQGIQSALSIAMSTTQAITASIGVLISFIIYKVQIRNK